jgi:hypothetical protein
MRLLRLGSWRSALAVCGAVGLVYGAASCSVSPSLAGESCNVFATDQTCAKGLTCQCLPSSACSCTTACDPLFGLTDGGTDAGLAPLSDGGAGCAKGYQCLAGVRPAEGATGYFCFVPDAG